MNCVDFRIAFDELNDSRRQVEKSDLSPEMVAHLEKCAKCAPYFETMNMIQLALVNMRLERIPSDLYWRLIQLGQTHGTANRISSVRPIAVHVLKILVPVLPLWITALFVPEPVRALIEMVTLVFGFTLMFERIGRSLIANRL